MGDAQHEAPQSSALVVPVARWHCSWWCLVLGLLGLAMLVTWGVLWAQRAAQDAMITRMETLAGQVKTLDTKLTAETAARTAIAVSMLKLQDDMREAVGTMREMNSILQGLGKDFTIIRRRLETEPSPLPSKALPHRR